MAYLIRPVQTKDSTAIVAIFNSYVQNSFATFTDSPVGMFYFKQLKNLIGNLPFYIVETENGELVGYGFLHPYHSAHAFSQTAEITYFINKKHTNKGNGEKLLKILMEKGKEAGIKTILACITSINTPSIDFHLKNGFHECGRFEKMGKKFDREFDLIWMQIHI